MAETLSPTPLGKVLADLPRGAQARLCRATGIDASWMARIKSGEVKPRHETRRSITRAFKREFGIDVELWAE